MMGKAIWRGGICAAALVLGGCGGGGGGRGVESLPAPPVMGPGPTPAPLPTPAPTSSPTPTPTSKPAPSPTPTPAPTPAPTPTPTPGGGSADTAEYRATVGAVSMNALAAYDKGATGRGVVVGVIDTGIDIDSAEFAGRISSASRDVASNRSVKDEAGHGTGVAFTLAGRRSGSGVQGVAYEATIAAFRSDHPGSCAGTAPAGEDPCLFSSTAIAEGLDAAVGAGARVVNISLGSNTAMPAELRAAVGRATAAGTVIVLAAGNDSLADPEAFALVANDAAVSRGQVIIAGSVSAGNSISTFSNRAGSGQAHYLTAVGELVLAPNHTGAAYEWSGTSFAAPQISGAAALLAQAFPNLSGEQIVRLLLATARDAGAAGVDPVYGNGVLDLTRAFQPNGGTTMAGTSAAVSLTANGSLSAPMGDARTSGAGAVILDGFSRAFAIDLAQTLAHARPRPALAGALIGGTRQVGAVTDATAVSVTLAPAGPRGASLRRTELVRPDAEAARAIAGTVARRLGSGASFGFAFGTGGQALTAQLEGRAEPAFLIAGTGAAGFDARVGGASAVRQQFGRLGVTAAIETGRVLTPGDGERLAGSSWVRSGYQRVALTMDRRFGPLSLDLSAGRLREESTLLGARLGGALGTPRGTSDFLDAGARASIADGWTLGARWRQGRTEARLSGLDGGGRLDTTAWSLDLGKTGLFAAGDGAGLRVAQPLRVARGQVDFVLPTHWDYATARADAWTRQSMNLAPTGRELDVEARYAVPLGTGVLHANLYWRREPGHHAALPDDMGVALRYGLGF